MSLSRGNSKMGSRRTFANWQYVRANVDIPLDDLTRERPSGWEAESTE